MKRYLFLLLAAAVLGLGSCDVEGQMEKVSIDGLEDVKVNGVTANRIGLDFYVAVSNFSNRNIFLQGGTVDVFCEGTKLYNIRIRERVKVGKRTQGTVTVPVIAEFTTPMGALGVIPYLPKYEEFAMNVEFTFKAGAIRKTYREEGIPLSEVTGDTGLEMFGPIIEQLGMPNDF